MALFKKPSEPQTPVEEPVREKTSRPTMQGENAVSIIGPGMTVTGNLVTDGTVRIEGRVEGTIRAGRAVIVGREGEVVGDVITQDAVIGGRVSGTVSAESRLELQASAIIEGEIQARAQHLQLEEGARFNGQIRMVEENGPEPLRAIPAEIAATVEF